MTTILTLVAANPDQTPLTQAHTDGLGKAIWLADNKAADITLETPLSHDALTQLRATLDADKIDVFQTATSNRRKKLLLADMDSTIVAEETLDELAAFAGLKDQVATITAKAMNGELDFHGAINERVALLKGLSTTALDKTLADTIVNPGAKTLVATLKANGATCVLVSGGFTVFTGPIADKVGFDHHHGNTLGINGTQLTGQVTPPILDKHAKVEFLDQYCANLNLTPADCMTIGDGANDLPMLQKAGQAGGLGVGYYAKPSVASQLTNIIRHGDLSAALYAMGFTQNDIQN